MITQHRIAIGQVAGHPLYGDSAYRLYASLLEHLENETAGWLHECGMISQFLEFSRENQRYHWTLNLLNDDTAAVMDPVIEKLTSVTIENQEFPILERTVEVVSLEDLLDRGREMTDRRSVMRFCTPTAFKQNGRYMIFPQERLILQSLLMQWNQVFPMCPLDDEDAFHALLSGIRIVDYQLRTSRFFLKGVRIPGYMGSCVLEAKLALPLQELWNTLLAFANYAGVGIKTGLGMGGIVTYQRNTNNQPLQ